MRGRDEPGGGAERGADDAGGGVDPDGAAPEHGDRGLREGEQAGAGAAVRGRAGGADGGGPAGRGGGGAVPAAGGGGEAVRLRGRGGAAGGAGVRGGVPAGRGAVQHGQRARGEADRRGRVGLDDCARAGGAARHGGHRAARGGRESVRVPGRAGPAQDGDEGHRAREERAAARGLQRVRGGADGRGGAGARGRGRARRRDGVDRERARAALLRAPAHHGREGAVQV